MLINSNLINVNFLVLDDDDHLRQLLPFAHLGFTFKFLFPFRTHH